MKIKLDVARNTSRHWDWFILHAKKHPSYSVREEEGIWIHSLEFEDPAEFTPFYEMVATWKMVVIYSGGKMITKSAAATLSWKERQKDNAIDDLTRALKRSKGGSGVSTGMSALKDMEIDIDLP